MLFDDEPQPKRQLVARPDLAPLGVEDLRAYIADLQAEIARAEMDIVKKQSIRAAADAFFRKPSDGE